MPPPAACGYPIVDGVGDDDGPRPSLNSQAAKSSAMVKGDRLYVSPPKIGYAHGDNPSNPSLTVDPVVVIIPGSSPPLTDVAGVAAVAIERSELNPLTGMVRPAGESYVVVVVG